MELDWLGGGACMQADMHAKADTLRMSITDLRKKMEIDRTLSAADSMEAGLDGRRLL
jgi:hypothetical protein